MGARERLQRYTVSLSCVFFLSERELNLIKVILDWQDSSERENRKKQHKSGTVLQILLQRNGVKT